MNYKIRKGDTLSKIAKANNTTVAELQKLNNIKDANLIVVGKTLTLPGQAKTEKPAATVATKATTKPIVAESDNTKVNNPVTGMQFKQPVKEKTTVSKSVPYESGIKSSVLERNPNKKEQATKTVQTKPAPTREFTPLNFNVQPATQDNVDRPNQYQYIEKQGTSEQQLAKKGITDAQSIPAKTKNADLLLGGRDANYKQDMYENFTPRGYWDASARLKAALDDKIKEENRIIFDKHVAGQGNARQVSHDRQRQDSWNLYNNKPQVYDTFSVSKYTPSIGGDKSKTYYSLNDPTFLQEVLNGKVTEAAKPTSKLKLAGQVAGAFIQNPKEFLKDPYQSVASVYGTGKNDDKTNAVDPRSLGHYTISEGIDEQGNEFRSYSDTWDLDPVETGTPFSVYGRVYKATGTSLPPVRKEAGNLEKKLNALETKKAKTWQNTKVKKGSQGLKFNEQTNTTMKYIIKKQTSGGLVNRYLQANQLSLKPVGKTTLPFNATQTAATNFVGPPRQAISGVPPIISTPMPPPPKDGFLGMSSKPRLFGPDRFQTTRNPNAVSILQGGAPSALSGYVNSAVKAFTPTAPTAPTTVPAIVIPPAASVNPAVAESTTTNPNKNKGTGNTIAPGGTRTDKEISANEKAQAVEQARYNTTDVVNQFNKATGAKWTINNAQSSKAKTATTPPAPTYSPKTRVTPELKPTTMPGGKMKLTGTAVQILAKQRDAKLDKLTPADRARVLSMRAQMKW